MGGGPSQVLSPVADEDLAASDFGIDVAWCAVLGTALPSRPPCVVLLGLLAMHLNTQSIEKFMPPQVCGARSGLRAREADADADVCRCGCRCRCRCVVWVRGVVSTARQQLRGAGVEGAGVVRRV
eukprot:2469668-Prymnesium_polylepis.1